MTNSGGTVAAKPRGPAFSPYRRAADLLQRLAPSRMRVGFFVGAGCPLAVRVDVEGKNSPLIPDVAGLTIAIKSMLDGNEDLSEAATTAWKRVVARGVTTPTIEDVLSHIRTLRSLAGSEGVDGFSVAKLKALDATICKTIRTLVSKPLPRIDTPYHALASWIQAVPHDKPIEIFTTNYDLLIEQALEEHQVPYFDGFVGSDSAFLDLQSMAEDDLPSRWVRLWKLHGSINWWMTQKNRIRRSRDEREEEQLLIYPSHLKYDESRQMPYLAMLDRLRAFLHSDQCVLITCGYSFADEHINAFIREGLSGNPNAACIAMLYGDRSTAPKAVSLAKRIANLTLLAVDGGVVGTVDRDWDNVIKEVSSSVALAIGTQELPGRSTAPNDRCKWLLGDFASFGDFLTHQLSSRDIEREFGNA